MAQENLEFQAEIKNQIKKFCLKNIWPWAQEDDEKEIFRKEVFQGLGEIGIAGMTTPEKYGGSGLSYHDYCQALIEVARYSVSYAVTLSVSSMVQGIINQFGNEEQKNKFLPELASGSEIGAFALTESGAGSDAGSLKMTAKKTPQGYILQGSKIFITSGGIAKTYIVMARTGEEGPKGISAFIVSDGMKGFGHGKKEKKMGWRASPTRELIFDQCLVPTQNLLGAEGDGFNIAKGALDPGRVTIGSIAVGLAKEAFERSFRYALDRKQFKKAIIEFQAIEFMFSDMAIEIESSELLVFKACQALDQIRSSQNSKPSEKNNFSKLASMAKIKATDTAMKVTTDAVQIFGGVGYTSEYPVERFMRDAKVLQIVEGTNQIQRGLVARCLKKEIE